MIRAILSWFRLRRLERIAHDQAQMTQLADALYREAALKFGPQK